MNDLLRVLIVEDSEDDALLLLRELRRGGYRPIVERVETYAAMSDALDRQTWDIILTDYSLPHFSAEAALQLMLSKGLDLPFIIVSGMIGEEVAVAAMKAGAHDYVMKDKLARLIPAIERELREATERRSRRVAEVALRQSEAKNLAILDAIPDAMFCIAQDGSCLDFIPAKNFEPLVNESDFLGKNIQELLPPRVASAAMHYVERALATGETQIFEFDLPIRHQSSIENKPEIEEFLTEDRPLCDRNPPSKISELHYYEARLVISIEDLQSEPEQIVVAIVRDITQKKRAEVELKQLNEELESRVEERTTALRATVEQLRVEMAERARLEAELRAALEKEKELNELKSRFVYMVTHEFRNPLTVVLGFTNLLEPNSDRWSTVQKKYFSRIKEAVKRMTDLLEDVLAIGRSEVEKLKFNPCRLNLENFCFNLVEEIEMVFQSSRKIHFIKNGTVPKVYMDEKLLRHIFSNLLSNALKYSAVGSAVTFKLSYQGEEVIFEIKDEGIGIPTEDRERLFELFHRANNVSNIPGTGLGLAIVKRAVDLHGGQIAMTSEVGIGTTFTVKLPLNRSMAD